MHENRTTTPASGESASETQPPSRRPPRLVFPPIPAWAIRWLLLPLAVVLLLDRVALGSFRVVGDSMRDTFEPGDFLIVSKLEATQSLLLAMVGSQRRCLPARGDVVVFRLPQNPSLRLVKRVVGLPGDRVVIGAGRVEVRNADHPDGFDPLRGSDARLTTAVTEGRFDGAVPAGEVFVLGDNRRPGASIDSREWGFLPLRRIVGTVRVRLLPVSRMRIFGEGVRCSG